MPVATSNIGKLLMERVINLSFCIGLFCISSSFGNHIETQYRSLIFPLMVLSVYLRLEFYLIKLLVSGSLAISFQL